MVQPNRVTIVVPTPPLLAVLTGCRNSRTARNLADVARRTVRRRRPAPCAELACCVRHPPRVVIVVPTPPRVVIVVPTPPRVVIVVSIQRIRSLIVVSIQRIRSLIESYRGVNPSSCRYRGANPSSCRYRGVNPAHKIPYRPWCNQTPVAIVVQTRGSTSSSCR